MLDDTSDDPLNVDDEPDELDVVVVADDETDADFTLDFDEDSDETEEDTLVINEDVV